MFRRIIFLCVIMYGLSVLDVYGDEKKIVGCGEQCIKVLCAYYNIDISQEKLVEFLQPKEGVASISDLERCISKIGLNSYAFKGNVNDLRKVRHPMIIHIDLQNKKDKTGHYILLVSDRYGNLTALDPQFSPKPIYDVTNEDLEVWTGKGLVVFANNSSVNYWLCLALIIFGSLSGSLIARIKNRRASNENK